MFRAIPKNVWKQPLDLKLHTTDEGELLVPFTRYVLQSEQTRRSSLAFLRFPDLPEELQLHIIGLCDVPTLFQLMHTSSRVRAEAEKLFFSSPDAWFCVDADWILRGCYAGDTLYDTRFLPFIEQLEIRLRWMNEDYWMSNHHCYGDQPEEVQAMPADRLEERMQEFWQNIRTHFPRVKRVTLCESYLRTRSELPPDIFRKLAHLCTPNIEVLFSFLKAQKRRDLRAERSMWQQIKKIKHVSAIREWTEIPPQVKIRVILPNKLFSGFLGAYENQRYKHYLHFQHEYTTFVMLTAAIEAHHFNGHHDPFQCPAPECEAQFDQPGEFTTHVIEESEHRKYIEPPTPLKALFNENGVRLKLWRQNRDRAWVAFREQWGWEGTAERRATEQAALYQIENDPLYAQRRPAHDSFILNAVLDALDGIV
ncbi:hypothetical protein M3J09_009865 [Ascochyta lentis]